MSHWFKFIFSVVLLLATAAQGIAQNGTLQIVVSNIAIKTGVVRIAVYSAEAGFMNEKRAFITQIRAVEQNNTLTFEFPRLPYGNYAVAVHHDLNNNSQMDKNLLGIPQEPYAFGNNLAGKWRCPRFGETQIRFAEVRKTLYLKLLSWSEK